MPFLQSLRHFCREDKAISSKTFLWPDFWSLRSAGHFRQERRRHLNQSIELKTDVLTQVCLTCILVFCFVLFSLMLIQLQAFLLNKKSKPSKISQSWIVFLWQYKHLPWGAEMFLRLGEGANPTETAELCLMLLHREPKTFQGFEAMAINRGETGLFYKQILRNWIAVRRCLLPAVFSFQESPSSCRLVAQPGQLFSFSWLWYLDVLLKLEVTAWVWNSLPYVRLFSVC